MLPTLFISHGAPTLPLDDCPARDFLKSLGAKLPRPRAVLAISAHWDNATPTVNRVAVNETIHDFYGFPDALYRMQYPAPGSGALAGRTLELLAHAGFATATDKTRGLDHGAWVPLMLMYPQADVPIVQLSIQSPLGPAHHFKLGRALAALRKEDVLVIGTGSFTHNLRALDRRQMDGLEPAWSVAFSDWIHAALTEGRTADLLSYRTLAPHAVQAHPTDDHFLPLFAALGAGGEGAKPERLHKSATFGSLRMDDYAFG
ncbi:MAG TPA: class III extradiol ring-cleavage dioxygenase [Micropepsaceae bacterium]|jgi:4,5-DOPA dioxygenase extradiol|nr:class III extradiol ring-cleavage dioxygenase [Micropepsaceae bacterium]